MLKKRQKNKTIMYSVDVFRSIGKFTNIAPLGYEVFTSEDIPDILSSKYIIELIGKRRKINNGKYEIKYYNQYGRSVIYYETSEGTAVVVFFNNLHVIGEK